MKEDKENLEVLTQQLQVFYKDYYGDFNSAEEEWQQLLTRLEPRENYEPVTPGRKKENLVSNRKDSMKTILKQDDSNSQAAPSRQSQIAGESFSANNKKVAWKWLGLAAGLVLLILVGLLVVATLTNPNTKPQLAANPSPIVPTPTVGSSQQLPVISGLQEITPDQIFKDAVLKSGPRLTNPELKLFVSDEATDQLVERVDGAFSKTGYKFSSMNSANKTAKLDSSGGFYTKTSLPDVLVGFRPIPANPLEIFDGLNVDAQSAQKLAAQFQNKKTLVMFILASNLEAAYRKPLSTGQVFYPIPTYRLNDGSLGHSVSLSQTVNGLNVQVRQVYADAIYLMIALEVRGPDGQLVKTIVRPSFTLTEVNSNSAAKPTSFPVTSWTLEGKSVVVFDTAGSPELAKAKDLKVKLIIGKIGAALANSGQATANGAGGVAQMPTADLEAGPFEFELTIPVESGKDLTPNQTVEANGSKLTLQRVTVTPLGAKFYLKVEEGKLDTTTLAASLEIAGKAHTNTSFKALGGNTLLQIEVYNPELVTQAGNWSLLISDSKAGQNDNWQFQFVVS